MDQFSKCLKIDLFRVNSYKSLKQTDSVSFLAFYYQATCRHSAHENNFEKEKLKELHSVSTMPSKSSVHSY